MIRSEIILKYWRKTANHKLIICAGALSIFVIFFDLQHYTPMARFQKYGLAIAIFGLGYLLQLIWSWRNFSQWAKASTAATGIFFASVGYTFYCNTWLDARVSVQTETHNIIRFFLLGGYFVFACIISAIWFKWAQDERSKLEKVQDTAHSEQEQ